MKQTTYRFSRRWLVGSAVLIVLVIVLVFWLTFYLEKRIEEKIIAANASISNIRVNLLTRSIHLHNLRWNSKTDSSGVYQHHLAFREVSVSGVHVITLLWNKRVVVQHLRLDSGNLLYTTPTSQKTPSAAKGTLPDIRIHNISISRVQFAVKQDTLKYVSGYMHGEVSRLHIQQDSINSQPYSVKAIELTMDSLQINHPGGEYKTTIQQIYISTANQQIRLDSLLLIPLYDKYEFAHKRGEQCSRINLSVPHIQVNGWKWEKLFQKSLYATSLHISSFDLFAFKDKRLPFLRTEVVPLPMQSFTQVKWPLRVDSVVIHTAEINIETFPEDGINSGTVTFNNVQATLTGLKNQWTKDDPKFAVMRASGLLMNSGEINAEFQFPLDGSTLYTTQGSISRMQLPVLNDLLGNMVNLRISSGYLQDMSFKFRYNEYTSHGSLDMAYQDLRILGLDKNKSSTHELKTLLIRLFTSPNKSKSEPLSRAVGVIDIERNRQKFIFNVWLKSILNGMQSSMIGNKKPSQRDNKK